MDPKRISFTPEDERMIASTSIWGILVAGVSIAAALTAALSWAVLGEASAPPSIIQGPEGALRLALIGIMIAIGTNVLLLLASLDFRKVALTDEADHAYLLQGFRRLRTYFFIQVVLIVMVLAPVVATSLGLSFSMPS